MSRTTVRGYTRIYGGNNKNATPSVGLQCIQFTLDPTAASADTGKVLPKGCIPQGVQNFNGGATGGTDPTVDVGTSGDTDGFANELDADGITDITSTLGALIGIPLTTDTAIHAGVGASAATGGSVLVGVYYIMEDDGQEGSNN